MQALTDESRKSVEEAVLEAFGRYVAAVNALDAASWAAFFSDDAPVTAFAGVDYYGDKAAWSRTVEGYFEQRASQRLEPKAVRATALAPDLALMTSEQAASMTLKDATRITSRHVYTMLWKKEQGGWRIIHSHESWVDE